VPDEPQPLEQASDQRKRQLADACAEASETIDAARAASARASWVLRATGQVLTRVGRALDRRAES
jgi:hypothetical protein